MKYSRLWGYALQVPAASIFRAENEGVASCDILAPEQLVKGRQVQKYSNLHNVSLTYLTFIFILTEGISGHSVVFGAW
jgi:hypothetical protein